MAFGLSTDIAGGKAGAGDGLAALVDVLVDHVEVALEVVLEAEGAEAGAEGLEAPVPLHGLAEFAYRAGLPGLVEPRIERVDRTAPFDGALTPGSHAVTWDLADPQGRPVPAGLYRGVVGINAPGQPEGKNLVNVSLRVDPALTADPPGLIWRPASGESAPQTANVTFSPNRFARATVVPSIARLTAPSEAIQIGDLSRPDPAADRWILSLRCDPAKLGDASTHGGRTIEVLDAAGAVLCTVPVLWFSDTALRAP